MRTHPILGATRLHTGVDWSAPMGTAVVAAVRGRVTAAGTEGPYGKRVIVDHGASYQTMYAQLGTISVVVGDCVAPGDLIGTVGVSGLTTGPHLHFEVRHMGQAIDPMSLNWPDP
ncbi:MAG TPA: M23 family metallopeptidase [Methyloceanibacter sp.]